MRPLLLLCTSVVAVTLCRDSSASEGEPPGYDIVLAMGVPVLGYAPAVAVRPEGEMTVGRLRSATMISSADVHSRIGFIRSDARLFMKDTGAVDGPSVIGTHFSALVEPVGCGIQPAFLFDLPWRNPCFAGGYAYRGEYNTLQYDYGRGTFAHAFAAQARIFSADLAAKELWLSAEWIARGAEPAFALTEDTSAPAKALEKNLARVGLTNRMAFGDSGRLFADTSLCFSENGLASVRYRVRYLHELVLAVLDGGDGGKTQFDFSVFVGAELEGGVNVRKQDALGTAVQSFRLLVGMPIGG